MERNIYLKNTDIEEAVEIYKERLMPFINTIKTEIADVRNSVGRTTSSPIMAAISSPNHNAAAMDGIMVVAEKTYGANEATPITLTRGEDFEYINTGHVIKEPYDSVIMIEDVVALSEEGANIDKVKIMVQAAPWQHVRPIGEDIVAGEMILPQNHKIRPMDIGAILSGGVVNIEVFEKISMGIMPTGTEITDDYENLEKGKIFDSNSWTFKAIAEQMGCTAQRISPVRDEAQALKDAILNLVENNHIVVINAGSSAGSKDFTSSLIEELGELVLHGIAIKPGKPTILGIIKGKPVIGVPGYPGSAFLVFEEVVGPIVKALQREKAEAVVRAEAVVSRRLISSLKYREYVRVKLGKVGEKLIATPLNRGAGVTMSLVKADGLLVIPKNAEGYEAGERVKVELTKDMSIIENTLVSIGSHDLIMDFLGSIMEKKGKMHLSSAHVGSMGGVMALKRGEAHIAPIHLLDEETGIYNTSYVEKYLGEDFIIIKGVKREQGFIVAKGNPKNIGKIQDLTENGISFVNRQKGSGTRILTDYLIKTQGIDPEKIKGYNRDMTTHMAVAAAVESGSADVGVGVYSAAKAMKLDFISIGHEEYDFAIAKKHVELPAAKAFLEALSSQDFTSILEELGGYQR